MTFVPRNHRVRAPCSPVLLPNPRAAPSPPSSLCSSSPAVLPEGRAVLSRASSGPWQLLQDWWAQVGPPRFPQPSSPHSASAHRSDAPGTASQCPLAGLSPKCPHPLYTGGPAPNPAPQVWPHHSAEQRDHCLQAVGNTSNAAQGMRDGLKTKMVFLSLFFLSSLKTRAVFQFSPRSLLTSTRSFCSRRHWSIIYNFI